MVRLGGPLLVEPGGWAWGTCILVAVDAASSGAGRGETGGSVWFVQEHECKKEQETMLQTWLWRLPVEEDRVRGHVLLLFTPRMFLDTSVGVGILLSVSGTEEWLESIIVG